MACLDDEGGDVVNEAPNNVKTISEMLSSLKSAFREADFSEVEAVLVRREAKLKLEIEAKAKENELLLLEKYLAEERGQYARLECLRRESEIEECKKECLRLKELNSQLCPELRVRHERVANYTNDKDVIIELTKENCELKCANLRMANEVDVLRSQFEDWEAMVSRLENDWAVLNGVEPSGSRSAKVSSGEDLRKRGVSEKVIRVEEIAKVKGEKEVIGENNEGCENVDDVKAAVVLVDENVVVEATNGGSACRAMDTEDGCMGVSGSGRPVIPGDVVEIGDSDDDSDSCKIWRAKETTNVQGPINDSRSHGAVDVTGTRVLKRKRASFVDISGNDSDQEGHELTFEHKLTKFQEFTNGPGSSLVNNFLQKTQPSGSNDGGKVSMTSRQDPIRNVVLDMHIKYDNEDSSSSSDSEDVDLSFACSVIMEKMPANGEHKKWETEGDMISALGKDRELCLRAVCALYRQQSALGKSSGDSSTSKGRGFNKLDAVRGTTLAEFLIDGDPQGKLKKSVKELVAHDQNGLEDCKRLAMEHSKQLFEIFQGKGDPLFLN